MHSAPSVSYPVGRSRGAARLLLAVWGAGLCCAVLAGWQWQDTGWRAALLVCGLLVSCAAVRHGMGSLRAAAGVLRFDGAGWSLSGSRSPSSSYRVEVCLDLQALLLVRLVAPGQSSPWLWLERQSDAMHWQDLRRAVYSRAPMDATKARSAGAPPSGASSTFS